MVYPEADARHGRATLPNQETFQIFNRKAMLANSRRGPGPDKKIKETHARNVEDLAAACDTQRFSAAAKVLGDLGSQFLSLRSACCVLVSKAKDSH